MQVSISHSRKNTVCTAAMTTVRWERIALVAACAVIHGAWIAALLAVA